MAEETKDLLELLQKRFEENMHRHPGTEWKDVAAALTAQPSKLKILQAMEETGGEPDVVELGAVEGTYTFIDCSPESPSGRRSICYDAAALEARKKNKPADSACAMAAAMGIELLDEAQYRALQQQEPFDKKTSSWIKTPEPIRSLGGALFCDRRYEHVFTYHNGADSYYAARGFRGMLTV
ncbi:hypothetical protein NCCP2716_22750 [Sporosarcina sp. NCCP-2716]|uniref:DUF4256 domain-containing protein n=1 Tax=Sporosarcina sp. NCCP-2716 TaxID=2943679 RepID=UPI00203D3309|nr:DUF4256 domain-containing protein [Sporosarcina sp. NCCP-2716]GKV69777.1 hypothetical protein NCCP2716_22750 [Sporosarcina sp. NCCP-2716]